MEHMDVKTTFLHDDLEEQTYMEQSDRFIKGGLGRLVCKLKRSLYWLKQSPRKRYKWFDSYMLWIWLHVIWVWLLCLCEKPWWWLFHFSTTICWWYVDCCNHLCDVNELKSLLSKEFDMKDLGPSKKILEIEIFSGIGNPNDYGSHNKVMLRRC